MNISPEILADSYAPPERLDLTDRITEFISAVNGPYPRLMLDVDLYDRAMHPEKWKAIDFLLDLRREHV